MLMTTGIIAGAPMDLGGAVAAFHDPSLDAAASMHLEAAARMQSAAAMTTTPGNTSSALSALIAQQRKSQMMVGQQQQHLLLPPSPPMEGAAILPQQSPLPVMSAAHHSITPMQPAQAAQARSLDYLHAEAALLALVGGDDAMWSHDHTNPLTHHTFDSAAAAGFSSYGSVLSSSMPSGSLNLLNNTLAPTTFNQHPTPAMAIPMPHYQQHQQQDINGLYSPVNSWSSVSSHLAAVSLQPDRPSTSHTSSTVAPVSIPLQRHVLMQPTPHSTPVTTAAPFSLPSLPTPSVLALSFQRSPALITTTKPRVNAINQVPTLAHSPLNSHIPSSPLSISRTSTPPCSPMSSSQIDSTPTSPSATITPSLSTIRKPSRRRSTPAALSVDTTTSGGPSATCGNCDTAQTSLWRRCGDTGVLLCNACGLFKKIHGTSRPLSLKKDVIKKRNRRAIVKGAPPPPLGGALGLLPPPLDISAMLGSPPVASTLPSSFSMAEPLSATSTTASGSLFDGLLMSSPIEEKPPMDIL